MVESICGQGFAYARDGRRKAKDLVKLGQDNTTKDNNDAG
jgi:hypothetical protein